MPSVTLLDTEGGEVEVSQPYIFVSLVYGRGYRPQTGTIAENLDILNAGGGPLDEAAVLVYLGDLSNPASDAYQAIEALASGGAHNHNDLYFSEAEITALLADKAPLADPTFTGTVSGVTKTHVGLGNVDNTSDANKPVSTAQQTALNLKANIASPTFTGTVGGITKSMVGLGNVDNTSDANKPVSTAQQTAIDTASTADRNRANHTGTQTSATLSDLTEAVQDIVGALIVAGTNTTVSYNDAAGTFTINSTASGGSTDPEVVRDTIGGALVAGSGIQITVNDAGDTITIASTAVLPTRAVNSGTGLTGGGDLSADRTLAVSYGSTAGTAVQGNDARVTADQAAGTASIRTLGTGAQQAAAGNHGHAATGITDSTATGRSVLTATDAAAARTAIGAGTSSLALGTTNTTAKAGDYQPTAANISDSTSVGRSILTAADAAAVRAASLAAPLRPAQTTQTGTSYTFVVGDANTLVEGNNASAITFTVPQNVFTAGDSIGFRQVGAGVITIAQGSGTTRNGRGGAFKTAGQWAEGTITFRSANDYVVSGDLVV